VIDLDYLIATKVIGWVEYRSSGGKLWHDKKTGLPTDYSLEDWQPSKSVSQTFEVVVEKMRKRGYEFWLNNEESFSEVPDHASKCGWRAEFRHVDVHVVEYGQNPAEAICKAALRAVGWVDEEILFFESSMPMERYEIKKAIEAIRKNPDDPVAHFRLGMVYSKWRRWYKAQAAFSTAISIKPNYAEAHAELAWVYYKLKQIKEALEEYLQAVNLEPMSAKAHFGLGLSYISLGDKASAIEEYNILKNISQEFADRLSDYIYK
jgi:tetratricopeptide (TPR) repeat protein